KHIFHSPLRFNEDSKRLSRIRASIRSVLHVSPRTAVQTVVTNSLNRPIKFML
ncbi:hypothetical protein L9F63_023346, partial [Diploptera punctata]